MRICSAVLTSAVSENVPVVAVPDPSVAIAGERRGSCCGRAPSSRPDGRSVKPAGAAGFVPGCASGRSNVVDLGEAGEIRLQAVCGSIVLMWAATTRQPSVPLAQARV